MIEMIKKDKGVFEYRGYSILLATTGYCIYGNILKDYVGSVLNLEEAREHIDKVCLSKNREEKEVIFTGVSFGFKPKVNEVPKELVSVDIGFGKQTVDNNISHWTYNSNEWRQVNITPMPVSDWETRFQKVGDFSIGVSNNDVSLANRIEEIGKLNPKPGEVLLVRVSNSEDGLYDRMRRSLDSMGHKDVHLIITTADYDLSQLDEAEMEKFGWIKKRDSRREFF